MPVFLEDPANAPAYIHCEQGIGRTGAMTAAYRMAINGWRWDEALAEAKRFCDGMPMQQDFIEQFGKAIEGKTALDGVNFSDLGYPKNKAPLTSTDLTSTRQTCEDALEGCSSGTA